MHLRKKRLVLFNNWVYTYSMAIINLTKENFDEVVLKSSKPVMVDFFTQWCGDCKRISPAVDMISDKRSESLIVGKVDCEAEVELKEKYEVMAYPTLYVFKNGEHGEKLIEPHSKAEIDEWLDKQI